jgi:hypothetical protein
MLVTIYTWLRAHPEVMSGLTLGLYHVASAFVGSLEMPNQASSGFYRFFFAFANRLAANYSRAGAAKDTLPPAPKV